jgi:hypothetical protein
VEPAGGLARQLLDVRQERDDVVARALLVLEDPAGTVPAFSISAQAASSTRSQIS